MVADMGTLHVESTVVSTGPLPDPSFTDRAKRKVGDLAWRFKHSKAGKITEQVVRVVAPVVGFAIGVATPVLAGWYTGVGVFVVATVLGAGPVLAMILAIVFGFAVFQVTGLFIISLARSFIE